MRQLIIHICIFLAPLVILCIAWPVDERTKFISMENDCAGHALWLHDRIALNPAPADIVFLGSSHSFNAVDDGFISSKIENTQVVNLAYCRLGTNLYLPLIRKLLTYKQPKKVVFEVRESEPRYSHPMFPYVAHTSEIFTAWPLIHPDYVADMYVHFTYKAELLQQQVFHAVPDVKVWTYPYGHVPSAGVADSAELHRIVNERNAKNSNIPAWLKPVLYSFPKHYLEKVTAMCKSADVEVYFLYLPGYACTQAEPDEADTYRSMGTLLIPPPQLFHKYAYWYDAEHLNEQGSRALSEWLTEQFKP